MPQNEKGMRKKLSVLICFTLFLIKAFGVHSNLQGPAFIHEPPRRVDFSNISGGRADCQVHGVPLPVSEWHLSDGTVATSVPDIRIVHGNGSLIFPPFPSEKFRHDVHAAVYRCTARNQVGLILSRDVIVKAVVSQKYEIQVHDEYVINGNTAILRCQVPSYLSDYILITSWIQDDTVHIYPTIDTGGKYAVSKSGELYIFNVDSSDGFKSFFCRTVNKLTGKSQSNAYPARVIITEGEEETQPRLNVDRNVTKYAKVGEDVVLSCAAQAFPVPTFRWFKEENDESFPVKFSDRVTEIAQGLLLYITKVKLQDGGKYFCLLNNAAGADTIHIDLVVTSSLSVRVQPQNQVVDVNAEAVFTCATEGFPISSVSWLHNGKFLWGNERYKLKSNPSRLIIRPVHKEDYGMYQCFVANPWDMAQSSAELRLGDASPELITWFTEQTLQPGPPLSLKCSGTGNPPPQFFWTLDGFPVPDNSRFVVGQYITVNDDVITHLNVSSVEEADGGEYTCTAKNSVSQVSHSARINIYGRPFIRRMPKVNAIAGVDLVIKCPVAGYPIESINWEQGGASLPINRRQKVFTNGTLIVENVQKLSDEGTYTCQAKNNQKLSDRRDVQVNVLVPPKILPAQGIVLREGMRAAVTCQVIDGDLPFTFRWEKNRRPIAESKIQVRRIDEYSSLLVIDNISTSHSGNYTCYAENAAGLESFTVPLTVNVPPKWDIEPKDVSVGAGTDIMLDCQASGHPSPSIVWKKSIGPLFGEYKELMNESNRISMHPNGSLKLERASKESEGHYLCEAKNGVGSGLSKLIFLKVNVQAHFTKKFKRVLAIQGEEAHLQCLAVGDAPLEVQWTLNGQTIQGDSETRYVIRKQKSEQSLISELSINKTYRGDTGLFSCHARNAFGEDDMKIQLIIQEAPEPPENIRVNDQQSRSLQVSWTQPYAGNDPIGKYVVQYKVATDDWDKRSNVMMVSGARTTATVQGLKPFTSYQVRVFAENDLGKSQASEIVQVVTHEEAPEGAPLEVRVEPETSTGVKVSWEPPPRAQWNGRLLGYHVGYQEQKELKTPTNSTPDLTGYKFQTIDSSGQRGGEFVIQSLNKFTDYLVVVQAFNREGAGPPSVPVRVKTKEDVPSSSPVNLHCQTASSQSIEVGWEPPMPETRHGLLLGYKVSYRPADEWHEAETKVTTLTNTVLSGLLKYTNYSVTILAFTSAGDGAKSSSIYCKTEEDLPSAPKDIKAAISAPNKMMVVWLPPRHKNGLLTCYTIYISSIEDGKEAGTRKRVLAPDTMVHETVRTKEKATYQFWVTASTKIGEGENSRVATIPPSVKIPARIMSFGRNMVTHWKETLNLTCRRVGHPPPQLVWKFKQKTLARNGGRSQVHKDGSLIITDVQKSDQGNYSCSVENLHGRDEIEYNLIVRVPPDRPRLSVVRSTSDSLDLEWMVDGQTLQNEVLGYVVNYKRDQGDWKELQLGPKSNSYSLKNLTCATRYQLYVTAYNKIGMSLPCDIVNTYTTGNAPVKPKNDAVVKVNETAASIRVDSWLDGGCPIKFFHIEYRIFSSSSSWLPVSDSVEPSDRVFVLAGLKPGTRYNVKVTSHNSAGSTEAIYNITTLPLAGVASLPTDESEMFDPEDVPFYSGRVITVALVLVASFSCALLTAVIVFLRKKRAILESLSAFEAQSVGQIGSESNRDECRQYLSIDVPQKYSTDGKMFTAKEGDHASEISPNTAFKISKPPHSESSYSGNIYSGPYHSVKCSFPFRDFNSGASKHESFKDSAYAKGRWKGDHLSENQESDNLGSTDSEVKKILFMHLPISEYDTLGSNSEGEHPLHSCPPAQVHSSFSHTPRSDKKMTKIKNNGNDSSSSSECSQKEFKPPVRKPRSKGQSIRRQARSGGGCSSHSEETTFSSHPTLKMSHFRLHSPEDLPVFKGSISAKLDRGTSFQIHV